MVLMGAELGYDNFEVIQRQSHAIKVTQMSKTAGNITISSNTTLCGFSQVINSIEALFWTLEFNVVF